MKETHAMNDHSRRQDCPSSPEHPAPQPNPPGDQCQDVPSTTPPELTPPDPCLPPAWCHCPTPPNTGPNCLQILIDAQEQKIALSAKAAELKKDLLARQSQADKASAAYNQAAYDDLLKKWQDLDGKIADLIRKVVCAVPCWRCVIECYVCPLLNDLHNSEIWLYKGGPCSDVHNLYDLRYWYDRDLDEKQRRLDRIKTVLDAWGDPAKTIAARLADNLTLYNSISNALGSDATRSIYDLFLRLIPMHLAIAPPTTMPPVPETTTKIDELYTIFCECDSATGDDCCGPDIGPWSFRERLIGPQPYLIDPADYYKVICCLVDKRYRPANDAVAAAAAALAAVDAEITRRKMQIDNFPKGFDGRGAIPSVVDCCKLEPDDDGSNDSKSSYRR